MRNDQIVTFFIGQCGCQIANACWELYCLEHSISPDGKYIPNGIPNDLSFSKLFTQTQDNQFVPRSLFVDLEPTVLDEVKLGTYRDLFNPEYLISGYEDAANNFARGFYSCGKTILRNVVKATRKLVEGCDAVHAFMAHHSFGGGTGSGFTSMLLEYLSVEYAKTSKIEFGVFPSPTLSVSVVEPYNTVLALHTPMENADVASFFENQSLYKICSSNLQIESPLYTHLNNMSAQVISGMTCSMRFSGPMNVNIVDYQTNLVPYPRIHFPVVNFSPFISQAKVAHSGLSVKSITTDAFDRENQMTSVNPSNGVLMSCCMVYRGDVNCDEINASISSHKANENLKWVDWCPTGYKIGINHQPMIAIPSSGMGYSNRSLTILCNTTAVKNVFNRLNRKFMTMYVHKSFVHWYISEGMEEEEFKEALDDILMLEKDLEVLDQTASIDNKKLESSNQMKSHVKLKSISKDSKSSQTNEEKNTTKVSKNTKSSKASSSNMRTTTKLSKASSSNISSNTSHYQKKLQFQNSKSESNISIDYRNSTLNVAHLINVKKYLKKHKNHESGYGTKTINSSKIRQHISLTDLNLKSLINPNIVDNNMTSVFKDASNQYNYDSHHLIPCRKSNILEKQILHSNNGLIEKRKSDHFSKTHRCRSSIFSRRQQQATEYHRTDLITNVISVDVDI